MKPINRWSAVILIAIMVIVAGIFVGLTYRVDDSITPNDRFFKVSIGPTPRINVSDYTLQD